MQIECQARQGSLTLVVAVTWGRLKIGPAGQSRELIFIMSAMTITERAGSFPSLLFARNCLAIQRVNSRARTTSNAEIVNVNRPSSGRVSRLQTTGQPQANAQKHINADDDALAKPAGQTNKPTPSSERASDTQTQS